MEDFRRLVANAVALGSALALTEQTLGDDLYSDRTMRKLFGHERWRRLSKRLHAVKGTAPNSPIQYSMIEARTLIVEDAMKLIYQKVENGLPLR